MAHVHTRASSFFILKGTMTLRDRVVGPGTWGIEPYGAIHPNTRFNDVTYGFGIQTEHCAKIVEYCREHGIDRVEVKPAAEKAWAAEMEAKAVDHAEYYGNCTPGYINFEGRGGHVWQYFYGAGPVEYRKVIDGWLQNGFDKDLDLRKAGN